MWEVVQYNIATGRLADAAEDRVAALIAAAPRSLTGTYAARPAANTVLDGMIYYATDVPEQYRSNGAVWTVVGSGGSELGYAQITAVTAAISTPAADIPGLSVTFVAGERPAMVTFEGMFLASTTATYAYLTLVLTAAITGQLLRRTTVAGEYLSLTRSARLTGLTPGTSYTVKARINVDAGTITPQGSATSPSWLSVKTL